MNEPQDMKARREQIATAVLAGFAAGPAWEEKPIHLAPRAGQRAAAEAVAWADALIEALDKGGT